MIDPIPGLWDEALIQDVFSSVDVQRILQISFNVQVIEDFCGLKLYPPWYIFSHVCIPQGTRASIWAQNEHNIKQDQEHQNRSPCEEMATKTRERDKMKDEAWSYG